MEPEGSLPGAGRLFLLRIRGHDRRVDIQRERPRWRASIPRARPGRCPGRPDLAEQLLVDRLDHPVRGRLRRLSAEQALLTPIGIHVAHAITTVGEHHRQIPDHPSRTVRRTPLPRRRQRPRQRAGQPYAIGQLDQQRHPSARDQPLSVRRHFYRFQASRSVHQLGVLLGRASRLSNPDSHGPGGRHPAPALHPYRRFEAKDELRQRPSSRRPGDRFARRSGSRYRRGTACLCTSTSSTSVLAGDRRLANGYDRPRA